MGRTTYFFFLQSKESTNFIIVDTTGANFVTHWFCVDVISIGHLDALWGFSGH